MTSPRAVCPGRFDLVPFATACALVGSGCSIDSDPPESRAAVVRTSEIREALPPGIHSVKGECAGKIALTPGIPHDTADGRAYPLIYDCSSKAFRILAAPSSYFGVADLTLTAEGYYLHQTTSANGTLGGYLFFDREGRAVGALPRPASPTVHDLIVRDDDVTYLKYVPDLDSAGCGRRAPLELEIITEARGSGNLLWKWSSKGHFAVDQKVATAQSLGRPAESAIRRWLRSVRHCYTAIARGIATFSVPKWFIGSATLALLQLDANDYIHANSIQRMERTGDILVSAMYLDTIFLIDRATKEVKWSLGGPLARATSSRPNGDSRGGFSHPHYARVVGETLWVFDNGNQFLQLPSRVVAYQLDSQPSPNELVFEFHEPNGRQRYALGSVQILKDDRVLVGWGSVGPDDRRNPQRAASIVDLASREEMFSIDLSPGWVSYRAKALQH